MGCPPRSCRCVALRPCPGTRRPEARAASPATPGLSGKTRASYWTYIGRYAASYLPPYHFMIPAPNSFLHPHGCQILEPRLGLHIPLHLGAQSPWVEVVHDKHPGCIFDDDLMHLGENMV